MNLNKNKLKIRLSWLAFLTVALFAAACSGGVRSDPPAAAETFRSIGFIKAIDAKAGTVTVDHQDIPGLMKAMTMTWPVNDPTLLDGLAVGDNIAFDVVKNGEAIKFTRITKAVAKDPVDGARVFASNCTLCHGINGEGTKRGIPLTSGHALAHTEDEYVQQVANGTPGKMPAFSGKLSDEQIAAVVSHLRNVIQAGVDRNAAKDQHKH